MKQKSLSLIKAVAISSVIVILLLVILFQKILPAYASLPQVKVIASELNVREAADSSSKIIGLVHRGETFAIIQTKNNWDQIKLSDNQTGWVHNAYVTSTENIEATVQAFILNVRENPSILSKVTGKLTVGSKLSILEEQGGWAKITSSSGVQGWVYELYITKETHGNGQTQSVLMPADQPAVSGEKDVSKATRSSNVHGLEGKTIVLDPGHGGIDAGTTSITGTPEKDLTLATAEAVKQKLESAGVHVIMTRTNDTYITLQERTDISNRTGADAFISFHYNWSNDPSTHGLTDFYYNQAKDSVLAADILNEVVNTTGLNKLNTKFDDLFVLRKNSKPSVLIELGFVSNKEDNSVVVSADYNDRVSQGVYQGLLDYFSRKNS